MAWIFREVLREWSQLSARIMVARRDYRNMIEAVQRFGWIDQANHSIRAAYRIRARNVGRRTSR